MDKLLTWIGQFLRLLDTWTNNYIWALLLFALLVEILMLPFGIKQQKNSIKQARLRPKEMAIRKKYAGRDDQATKQKIAQEIQDLYQKENFNQFAGCLPLLIQLPVIMILYYVVINPLHYEMGVSTAAIDALRTFITTATADGGLGVTLAKNSKSTIELIDILNQSDYWTAINASFASFAEGNAAYLTEIQNAVAAGLPDFTVFGLNLGEVPTITSPSWLWAIPVLTFGTYFGSMKLNRKLTYQPTMQTQDMGCSNNVMDIMMPAFSVYITFIVPAAVGVYWIFKSLLGTIKQFILFKIFPLPQFTEEDYKAAEREMAGKTNNKKSTASNGNNGPKPGVRSLHHIDDDDFLPPVSKEPVKKSLKETSEPKTPVVESPIEAAPFKEDRLSEEVEDVEEPIVEPVEENNDNQE